MGVLLDGEWHPERDQLTDTETGRFERDPTTFRGRIEDGGEHPPEAGRYHLYVSRACPWAHRTMIVRTLLGLEDAVSVDIVDPVRIDDGWEFSPEKADCTPDRVNGSEYLREVYTRADPAYSGRVSVPVLWDKTAETIVNNESSEIIRIFDSEMGSASTRAVSLYPADLPVQETIEELYGPVNDGVYRAGFAGSQAAYTEAVERLFDALDRWDQTLSEQRFVCGDRLTAADVCLFTTMFRFDEIYHTHFKCNHRTLREYPNLWGHTREIYQLPGVAHTCNMDHCKMHYYRSHTDINPSGIVPIGPNPDFEAPHDRDRFPGALPEALVR